MAIAVSNDCQSGKAELTATFDNLCDAVNGDQLFNQVVVALLLIVSCQIYYSAGYLRLPFRISVLLPELHRPVL